jgi:outer membrane protein
MRSIVIPVVILGVAGAALAQEAAAPKSAPPGSARIAVIDMGRVSSESLLGKSYATQLEQLKNEIDSAGTKKQNDLNKMDADIKTLSDELDKQSSVLSPEATEKKTQEIKKKQRDRQAFLEDGQAELERMREKARVQAQAYNNEFQAKIRPHIDVVAKEKGIDILLDSQVAITVNRVFDISQDVIVRADDAERAAGKGAAAAAKPPAKPSPTPTPKP